MSVYQEAITIHAGPDQVFDYVSNVENLPEFLPTLEHAEPEDRERVRMHGESHGHTYDTEAFYHADRENRRMTWGSDRRQRYSGELEVQPWANGAQLVVKISYEPAAEGESPSTSREQEIRDEVKRALLSVRNILEGRGGKVREAEAA